MNAGHRMAFGKIAQTYFQVGLLPEVEQRAEDPEPVEGPTARGRARAALAHRRPPPSSVLCRGYLDASRVISEPDPRDRRSDSSAAPEPGKEVEHLEVQPDDRGEQAPGRIPLHERGRPAADAAT